jgi:hypothetical protein
MPRTSSTSTPKKSPPISNYPAPFKNPYSSVANVQPSAPTFGQTLKEGFALGTGSALAHRAIGSIFGAPTVNISAPTETKVQSSCEKERMAFETCMKFKSADDFCGNEQLGYAQCLRIARDQD